jgi:hypothetical protein
LLFGRACCWARQWSCTNWQRIFIQQPRSRLAS